MEHRRSRSARAVVLIGCVGVLVTAGLVPADATTGTGREAQKAEPATTILEVKVADEAAIHVEGGNIVSRGGHDLSELDDALSSGAVVDAAPLLGDFTEQAAAQFDQVPSDNPEAGNPASWLRVEVRTADVEAIVAELRTLPGVEDTYIAPRPAPPPATPNFVDFQAPLLAAPDGLGIRDASVLKGATGKAVRVADVEYSWNTAHEDLAAARVAGSTIAVGTPANPFEDDHHGTGVLGVLAGKKNTFGVQGEAYSSRMYMVNAYSLEYNVNVAMAITAARKKLRAGDVLLLEQQTYGPFGEYLPVEWVPSVYDAIASATAAGIVVIEAAGNGGVDLDDPAYGSRFPSGKPDSGAIMVGAGDACPWFQPRERLTFSNYGTRVDVQGHGNCVVTSGYGYLYDDGPNARYTDQFNGTSSASATVAGAAAVLSSGHRAAVGGPPSPSLVRSLFIAHGTPQPAMDSGHIGPLPDVFAALISIDVVAPTAPRTPSVSLNGKQQPVVRWKTANDNQGIKGYRVHRNGQLVADLPRKTSFVDTAAASGTHSYAIFAVDYAGNLSPPTSSISISKP